MAHIHQAYDPTSILGLAIGPTMVDVFEQLGFFRVFSAPWFVLLLTLLVGQHHRLHARSDARPVAQRAPRAVGPAAAFLRPAPGRTGAVHARWTRAAADELTKVLREKPLQGPRDSIRDVGGVRHVYGDRNQYFKLATLFTHLGLILFLAGGGDHRRPLASRRSSSWAKARPRRCSRSARRTTCWSRTSTSRRPRGPTAPSPTSGPTSPSTGTGSRSARKIIRVNDPLEVERLRLPPEHVRAGREPGHPRSGGATWCGAARCSSPASWPAGRRVS